RTRTSRAGFPAERGQSLMWQLSYRADWNIYHLMSWMIRPNLLRRVEPSHAKQCPDRTIRRGPNWLRLGRQHGFGLAPEQVDHPGFAIRRALLIPDVRGDRRAKA